MSHYTSMAINRRYISSIQLTTNNKLSRNSVT